MPSKYKYSLCEFDGESNDQYLALFRTGKEVHFSLKPSGFACSVGETPCLHWLSQFVEAILVGETFLSTFLKALNDC